MKILFIARHFTYFRNFDSVITALAARGHQVHLSADRDEAQVPVQVDQPRGRRDGHGRHEGRVVG